MRLKPKTMTDKQKRIEKIRDEFLTTKLTNPVNTQGEPDIEYVIWLEDILVSSKAENAELREALTEITKGEGRYSLEPLRHAWNCIEDMIQLAKDALKTQDNEQ